MPKAIDGIKFCTKCKLSKPVTEFHKDKSNLDGFMQICIKCKREYRISPFYKQREKDLEKTPRYMKRKKTFRTSDKGKFNCSRDKHKAISKLRGSGNIKSHDLTFMQWECIVANQGDRCAICQIRFDNTIPPVRDCIIPMTKGGFLTLENTQALCFSCNAIKHTSLYSGLGNRWRAKYNF